MPKLVTDRILVIKGKIKITPQIVDILKNNENIIISLDYESHKQLNSIGIKHEIYDDYLNENDRKNINEVALNITTNWHKNKTIQEYLTLNEINFGWLLDQEFHPNLLSIITIFFSLLKISEKLIPKSIIFSNDLLEMINVIFPDCEKIKLEVDGGDIQQYYFDRFSVKYNIGNLPLTFRMPRKYFFALRYYYERIFIPLFNIVFSHLNKKNNSILLVDFNPAQYYDFLKHITKRNANVFLLNRRRAAIWNFRSFLEVKKTNSIPITYEKFLKLEHKLEIKNLTSQIIKNLNSLLCNDNLFSEIFSINNKSFWLHIKKNFKRFCVERFSEAIYEMVGSRELLLQLKPSYILHFYEATLHEKVLIFQSRKQNISSILVQHGTPFLSLPGFSMLNPIIGTLPLYNDKKMAVWGNLMKEYCMRNDMTEDNIIISGSMRHDEFFHIKKHNDDSGGIILIALGQLNAVNIDNQTITTYERFEKCLNVLCKVVRKIENRKKIAKLHPGDMVFNTIAVEPIIHQMDPSIHIVVETDLKKLLQAADVVISIGLTTVLMEANILEKPTITLVADHQDYLSILSNGHTKLFTDIEEIEFEKFLHTILNDNNFRNEQIKKGINFVNAYLSNQGTASEYLAKKITE